MSQLEFAFLISDFYSSTIRLPCLLVPANSALHTQNCQLLLDTGAGKSALTKEFLNRNGYGIYSKVGKNKMTASGEAEFHTCEVNDLTIANQFKLGKMKFDVLQNWKTHSVVGLIGMDMLSQMTLILSHTHKKFLLTDQKLPELEQLFS
ncbi:MAG: retroviral-like aspartic protease family protein [Defluviitaleaceae bacterium]|nr:retroviral-like aspartic protease family protein [Defluviitaleaceae bacterium]